MDREFGEADIAETTHEVIGRPRRRWVPMLLAVTLLALGAACAAPSGGTFLTTDPIGYGSGQISVLQPVDYYYAGTAGDRLTVTAYAFLDIGPATSYRLAVFGPSGRLTPIRTTSYSETVVLPVTGRYKIEISMPTVVSNVWTYHVVVALDRDRGPASLGVLTGPTDNEMFTYSYAGTSGERLDVSNATVVDPDGNVVPPNGLLPGQVTLPVDGTYAIELLAGDGAISHDVAGGLIGLGGATIPTLLPNQHIGFAYVGTAGEALGIVAPNFGIYQVVAPDGTVIASNESVVERLVLPLSGTYTITAWRSTALWLSHDFEAGALAAGITSPPAGLVPGQSMAYTIAGTTGEVVQVRTVRILPIPACDGTHPPGRYPNVTQNMYDPSGTRLACTSGVDDGVDVWLIYHLPTAGTYRLVITPTGGSDAFTIGVQTTP